MAKRESAAVFARKARGEQQRKRATATFLVLRLLMALLDWAVTVYSRVAAAALWPARRVRAHVAWSVVADSGAPLASPRGIKSAARGSMAVAVVVGAGAGGPDAVARVAVCETNGAGWSRRRN